jgi:hypothetical protein
VPSRLEGLPTAASEPSARTLAAGRAALLALSVISLLPSVLNSTDGDCHIYRAAVQVLFSGRLPYRDAPLEYPPYALPFFVLPYWISSSPDGYHKWFAAEMLLVDLMLKGLLLVEGKRLLRGWWTLFPCALFVLDGWFQMNLYLKRYDILPAALTVVAVVALSRGRTLASGGALAAGIGLKLYPAVLLLPFLAVARRQGSGRRLALGVGAGLAPLALLAAFFPWWRFAVFHAGRGLQAESLAGSIIWWLHRTVGLDASWNKLRAWTEVGGPAANASLFAAKALFATMVILSVAVATLRAIRATAPDLARLARLLLLPLLAFIVFNNVLSPQYAIWYFPLVALAATEGSLAAPLLLVLATAVIPFFWPSTEYQRAGLGLARASALLFRNLLFVAAWWLLFREQLSPRPVAEPGSATRS